MYRTVDLLISGALTVLGLIVVIAALFLAPPTRFTADPIGPSGFAVVIGSATAGLAGAVFVRALRRGPSVVANENREDAGSGDQSDPAPLAGDDPSHPASSRRAVEIMALTVLYAVLLPFIGYLIATPIYLTAAMWTTGSRGTTKVIVFPLVLTLIAYVIFGLVMGVRIPLGPLEGITS